jgi:anti-anti-sigma factor
MRELTVAQYNLDDLAVLAFAGDIDRETAPDLRQHLVETITHDSPRLIVDLTDADLLDSTGLGVLVGSLHRARAEGGWLRVVCTGEPVRKLLRTTGLDHVLPIHDTLDSARADTSTPRTDLPVDRKPADTLPTAATDAHGPPGTRARRTSMPHDTSSATVPLRRRKTISL